MVVFHQAHEGKGKGEDMEEMASRRGYSTFTECLKGCAVALVGSPV